MKLVKNRSFDVGAYYIESESYANEDIISLCKYLGVVDGVRYMQVLYETRCVLGIPRIDAFDESDCTERTPPFTWEISLMSKNIYKLNDDEVLKYVVMRSL